MPKTQKEHLLYTIDEWEESKYSDLFQNMLDTIFSKDDIQIIYDIGANVGGTAIVFHNYAKKHKKNLKMVYCFEPEINNYNSLLKNLEKYSYSNKSKAYNFGIFYGKTESKLYSIFWNSETANEEGNNCGGYITDEEIAKLSANNLGDRFAAVNFNGKLVKLDTLENLELPTPDFIKIDIEGSEKNIIENSTIIHKAKYLLIEFTWKNINREEYFKKYLPNHKIISPIQNNDILFKKI